MQAIVESAPVKRRGNPYRDADGKFCKESEAVYVVDPETRALKKYTKKTDFEERANPYHDKAAPESRAATSKVERRIVKKQNICERCRLNDDPKKVPVHPNCDCDVITDSLETGVGDPSSRLFNPLTARDIAMELVSADKTIELPSAIQLNPDTTAILDGENVRFADLARWLEQMQPYLQQGAQYLSIVVDDDTDEAVQQVTETIDTIAEDIENFPEAIRNRKLWFSLAKSVVF